MEHRRKGRNAKALVIGITAAALVTTAGVGSAVYLNTGKDVVLSIDGKERTVTTRADTVADVLGQEELKVGKRDLVAPAKSASIGDGTRIAVRYGRPLELVVDGQSKDHWVTAVSVDQAFDQLGLRYEGAKLSASRSSRIDRDGMRLEVSTLKKIQVAADKKKRPVATTAVTVDEALAAAKVTVDKDDKVKPARTATLSDGDAIKVTRVKVKEKPEKVDIPFETIEKEDSSMYEDEEETTREGEDGEKSQVVRKTYHDGKLVKTEKTKVKVLKKPVSEIVTVGTKEREDSGSDDSGDSGDVGGGADGLNWSALAQCESGGNPSAVSPNGQYHGLYQFSVSTWNSVGGSGLPSEAPSSEQTMRAKMLYNKAGAGQWPVCGQKLFS